ncbi:hypothetical protein ACOSQ4_009252 [Xanthoceras sorbifolium]
MGASSSTLLSSTTTTNGGKYDLFISFRGEDIRDNFRSHLCDAFSRKQIDFFVDDKLEKGDGIWPTLSRAIEESKISVIIFSKDYASSKWCLRELVKILECKETNGQIVIPVFYQVNPSDVRKQTGSFQDALVNHDNVSEEEKQIWRTALTEASNLSGWHSSVTRPESRLIDEIVKDVLKKLNDISPSSDSGGLVGIHSRVEDVKSLLCIGMLNFRVVGIWGMGGMGKTTIAAAVFDQISSQFEGCCFLANVREESEKCGGLVRLQREILCKILEEEILNLGTPNIPMFVKRRLQKKKVFIVLDDVNNLKQLEILAGGLDQFGPGSRVIITTRDKQLLCNCGVGNIYKVEALMYWESLQLFCKCAFKQDCPPKDLMLLAKRVVDYAKGNPLALKVLGLSLNGKGKQEWESALDKLQRILNPEILDVLKISYDGLDDEEKDIFLDIACFFKGEERDYVAKILGDCYYPLSVLIAKSLIIISKDRIQMHDLLQEMGKEIVRKESPNKPGNRSRLWRQEDVLCMLKNDNGTDAVQGILLDMSEIKDVQLKSQAFEKMYNLRFLKFYDPKIQDFRNSVYISQVHFPNGLNYLSNELRSFQWHGCPLKVLHFNPEKLVELHLSHSNVEQLWEGTKHAPKLKWLILSDSRHLTKIPDFSDIPLVEKIDLENCISLLEIHSSIQCLNNLCYLNARGCVNLRSFLSNIHFEALESLDLSDCINLTKFPMISGNIRRLYLCRTGVEEVPSSIQSLMRLVVLDMSQCRRLRCISTSICKLKCLKHLNLKDCSKLESFPSNIHFEALESLDLSDCINLTKFPQIFGNIRRLFLHRTGVEEVPSSIQSLNQLVELGISECTRLKHISTSICKLKSLDELKLLDCSKLESFPEILETMECLKLLCLSGTAIKELPTSIDRLKGLKRLSLSRCENLEMLPNNICNLTSLICLELLNCSKLDKLSENLGNLKSLILLLVNGSALCQLPDSIASLEKLEVLNCSGCRSLTMLPPLSGLCSLRDLSLNNCTLMEIPEDIGYLSSLEQLGLCGNVFESLPKSIKQLSKLRYLTLNNCNMLQSLKELPLGIQYLEAMNCKQLCQSLPDASEFKRCIDGGECLRVIFTNCLKLDHKAVSNIFAESLLIMSAAKKRYKKPIQIGICFPGSEIPEWFSYQNSGSLVNVQVLRHNWDEARRYMGLALSVVIGFEEYYNDYQGLGVHYEYHFETSDGYRSVKFTGQDFTLCNWQEDDQRILIDSDHILLGYVLSSQPFAKLLRFDCDYAVISFEFKVQDSLGEPLKGCKVKYCGVHPIFLESTKIIGKTCGRRSGISDDHEETVEPHSKRICTEANQSSPSRIMTLDLFK